VSLKWVERSSVETILPHDEQNRASAGTCEPHELQRVIGENASTGRCSAAVYVNGAKMGIMAASKIRPSAAVVTPLNIC
jgi:hypothetical protein